LLKCHDFIEEFDRNGRGIVADLWTTRYDEMKTIWLPLPPRVEQDQIVRYLDWKMSQINKLINAKRRQSEEKMQTNTKKSGFKTIITNFLTKLDPRNRKI